MADRHIVAVNLKCQMVLLSDNSTLPIVEYYDEDGDKCDLEDAVGFSAGADEDGCYYNELLEDYKIQGWVN